MPDSGVVVPGTGLEPARLSAHGPKPCASANSAIPALVSYHCITRRGLAQLWFLPESPPRRLPQLSRFSKAGYHSPRLRVLVTDENPGTMVQAAECPTTFIANSRFERLREGVAGPWCPALQNRQSWGSLVRVSSGRNQSWASPRYRQEVPRGQQIMGTGWCISLLLRPDSTPMRTQCA